VCDQGARAGEATDPAPSSIASQTGFRPAVLQKKKKKKKKKLKEASNQKGLAGLAES